VKLEGRIALVTGAARGLNAYHPRALAREGAKVAALDICQDIAPMRLPATRDELPDTSTPCTSRAPRRS